MKNPAKRFLITALLATLAGGAMAQTPSAAPADGKPMAHGGMAKRDPAKMQEVRAKRMAELKQKLVPGPPGPRPCSPRAPWPGPTMKRWPS